MLILELHTKNMEQEYDYNCFMLETPFKNWNKLLFEIDDSDVYDNEKGEFGKENESHITILYGLHGDIPFSRIKKITDNYKEPIGYNISGIGVFQNEDYDVLKLDIESEGLRKLHNAACKYPYTSDYDEYHPHMTVSYLKSGMGKKYSKIFEQPLQKESNRFSYSTVDGKKYYWDL